VLGYWHGTGVGQETTVVIAAQQEATERTRLASSTDTPRVIGHLSYRRGRWLADGLRALGVGAGADVVIVCCDEHATEQDVAVLACASLQARSRVISPEALGSLTAAEVGRPRLVLACAEGFDHWLATGVPAMVVSDAPEVLWWRVVELNGRRRERAEAARAS
jgi:hypothetical protein